MREIKSIKKEQFSHGLLDRIMLPFKRLIPIKLHFKTLIFNEMVPNVNLFVHRVLD